MRNGLERWVMPAPKRVRRHAFQPYKGRYWSVCGSQDSLGDEINDRTCPTPLTYSRAYCPNCWELLCTPSTKTQR